MFKIRKGNGDEYLGSCFFGRWLNLFFVLVLVGWAIIAGLIDGIKKAYKERTK